MIARAYTAARARSVWRNRTNQRAPLQCLYSCVSGLHAQTVRLADNNAVQTIIRVSSENVFTKVWQDLKFWLQNLILYLVVLLKAFFFNADGILSRNGHQGTSFGVAPGNRTLHFLLCGGMRHRWLAVVKPRRRPKCRLEHRLLK